MCSSRQDRRSGCYSVKANKTDEHILVTIFFFFNAFAKERFQNVLRYFYYKVDGMAGVQ